MSRRDILIFALGIIKDECYRHGNCMNCPLQNKQEMYCTIQKESPQEWYVPDLFEDDDVEPIF